MVIGDVSLNYTAQEGANANALTLQFARPKAWYICLVMAQKHYQLTEKSDMEAAIHTVRLAVER
jgi:hypothetical protein